jgi:hypothetical protein
MAQVAAELEESTTDINLNKASVRTLAGVPSGAISMSDLYGKSSLAAYINEASFDGSAIDFGSGATAYTGYATLTVTGGGTGGITYQWYQTGGAVISAATSATTRFSLTGNVGASISGTVWCVVTREGVSRTTATKAYDLNIVDDGA